MKLLLVCALLAVAAADSDNDRFRDPRAQSGYADDYYGHYAKPSYRYGYRVDEPYKKLRFSKREKLYGDRTDGSYSVLLPDGRTQTVTYWVEGDSGFQAVVKFTGKATYPPVQPHHPPHRPHSGDDDGVSGPFLPEPPRHGPIGLPSDDDGSKPFPPFPNTLRPHSNAYGPKPFPPFPDTPRPHSNDDGSKPFPPFPSFPDAPRPHSNDDGSKPFPPFPDTTRPHSNDDGSNSFPPFPPFPDAPRPHSNDDGSKPFPGPPKHVPFPPRHVPIYFPKSTHGDDTSG